MTDRELFEMALEALKVVEAMLLSQEDALRQMRCDEPNAEPAIYHARDTIAALRERLEQPTVKESLQVEQPQQEQNIYGSDKTSTLGVDAQKNSMQHEPVAKACANCWGTGVDVAGKPCPCGCKPYTAAQRREWRGLTDQQLAPIIRQYHWAPTAFARAIEAKLREKNG